jgi:hypothetical protein
MKDRMEDGEIIRYIENQIFFIIINGFMISRGNLSGDLSSGKAFVIIYSWIQHVHNTTVEYLITTMRSGLEQRRKPVDPHAAPLRRARRSVIRET